MHAAPDQLPKQRLQHTKGIVASSSAQDTVTPPSYLRKQLACVLKLMERISPPLIKFSCDYYHLRTSVATPHTLEPIHQVRDGNGVNLGVKTTSRLIHKTAIRQ